MRCMSLNTPRRQLGAGMNVRKGMARIARVTTIAYWLVAVAMLAINFPNELSLAQDARDFPVTAAIKTYPIEMPDGKFDVDARSEQMLDVIVKAHAKKPPEARRAAMLADSYLQDALHPDKGRALVEAARRERLLQIDEPTRRKVIERGARERRAVFIGAAISTSKLLAWWAGAYLAIWAVFSAIRWIALGFMDRPDTP